MAELNKLQPETTGKNRGNDGKFLPGVSGNPSGRPSESFSITKIIKEKLQEIPKGEKITYAELIIEQILIRASAGDPRMIKQIWEYIDGKPREILEYQGDTILKIDI